MNSTEKLKKAIQKELDSIEKAETKLRKKAKMPTISYKEKIEAKIPKGINSTLQTSFSKAFGLIFERGIGIIEKGYDNEYGARPLKRVIQRHVEDKLSEEILRGNLKDGMVVTIEARDGELIFLKD